MCGICGFNWTDRDAVTEMAAILEHRGPDQAGFYCAEGISLGHRRLSIIDLSENGRQPITNEDASVWVVFNGEIYNYRPLRELLISKGHIFRSRTDSEVLVHAYEEWGIEFIERLNGMFAFALWDNAGRILYLVRDRLGEKPLYYHFEDGRFVFASEVKAVLKNPRVTPQLDETALNYFLGFEFVPAPRTMFAGIRKLPAGHYLRLKDGSLQQKQYWDLPSVELSSTRSDWQEELLHRLQSAVGLRMESDVPLGAFLSGGIDSSSVVAMMRKATNGPIRTFCLGYREASFTEFEQARRVADHFGTEHTEHLIDPVTPEVIERAIWHLDEPMSEFSVLPYYLICQKARESVTVCLSGEGGDEIFVGYDRFKASRADAIYRKLPAPLRQVTAVLLNCFPDRPQKKGAINCLKRFVDGSLLPEEGAHMRWQYFLTPDHGKQLFKNGHGENIITESLELVGLVAGQCRSTRPLDKEIYAELRFMMPENPLMKVDKMSMAHSLEIRAPLLDHELVEFAARIPSDMKLRRWTTKSILKKAMEPELPSGIAYRPKHGYSFPIKHWLRGDLSGFVKEVLLGSSLIRERFNRDYVELLLEQHLSSRQNHNHLLWGLVNLAIWHQKYFSVAF